MPAFQTADLNNLMAAIDLLNEEVRKLREKFDEKPVAPNGTGTQILQPHPPRYPGKSPRTSLVIDLNGQQLTGNCAADVLADAIESVGPARVEALKLSLGGLPLVSQSRPRGDRGYRMRGNWFVVTHASNAEKAGVLHQIASRLGISLQAQVGYCSTGASF